MARPGKIRLNANRKITALSTEGALDRWNPGVHAAVDGEATISIYSVIGEDPWSGDGFTVKRLDGILRTIGADRDVTININSPGGDVFEGIAIYNRLREHQGNITVKVIGIAASAASVVAMAGDQIQIGAASFIMIHNCWVLAIGNRHDMKEVADFLEPFDRAMAEVYAARTGQDVAVVGAAMDTETWFPGSQAVELGYADALLPADEITQAEPALPGDDATKALRRAEAALCHDMPRSAARDLLKKIKGMPDAALDPAMPDAGDPELTGLLAGLLDTLRA